MSVKEFNTRTLVFPGDLAHAFDLADISGMNFPHVADWPYRFSSWALDNPLNTQGWFDASSRLWGWAVLQTPFWAIDCLVHPDAPPELYPQMLTWAKKRAKEMVIAGEGHPDWFISIAEICHAQRRSLESLGFEDMSGKGEDSWSKVLFELGDDQRLPVMKLPKGFQIRSLNPDMEIQAYVDLHREVFQTENMTFDWRKRATQAKDYDNTLDLVVVSEKGSLEGFCVAWLRRQVNGEIVGQIEPLGVRESQRGQKLSQVLLLEAIRRLQELHAIRIFVETDKKRTAAMEAYASMGFKISREVKVYRYIIPVNRLIPYNY